MMDQNSALRGVGSTKPVARLGIAIGMRSSVA
jgi:hypothetical protein